MWYRNKLSKRLGVKYPIIQAGMAGGVTTPLLISEVSEAGALGTLGAGYLSAEETKDSIQKIKARTANPFSVNVFIPEFPEVSDIELEKAQEELFPYRQQLNLDEASLPKDNYSPYEEQLEVIMRQRVPVCSFTFGVPAKSVVTDLKKENIILIGTATTVEEAVINEERGIDVIVAQGSEAGGHRGTFSSSFDRAMVGTMSLVPQIVDEVSLPVIAAGGIMDGRGVAAALMLGAKGVQMGTAFVTCQESGAKSQHKAAVSSSKETDVVMSKSFSGKPARAIDNQFIQQMNGKARLSYPHQNFLTKGIRREAAKQNRPEWMSLWSGQSPRLSQTVHAGHLVSEIAKQVDRLLNENY